MSKRPHAHLNSRRVRVRSGSLDGSGEVRVEEGVGSGSDEEDAYSRSRPSTSQVYVLLPSSKRSAATTGRSAKEGVELEDEDEEIHSLGSEEVGADIDMELDAPEDVSRASTPSVSRVLRKRTSMVFVDLPTRVKSKVSRRHSDRLTIHGSATKTPATRFVNGLMTPPDMTPSSARAEPEPKAEPEPNAEPEVLARYISRDEEVPESENLDELLNEASEDDEDEESDDDEDAPVRVLDDFSFYDPDSLVMLPFWDLVLESRDGLVTRRVVASGAASSRLESDSDSENEESDSEPLNSVRVKLSLIIEVNFLWWYPLEKSLDADIWVRTQHAWYVLREPSPSYGDLLRPFSRAHYAVYSMTTYALANPRASLSEFLDDIDSESQPVDLESRDEYEGAIEDVRMQQLLYDVQSKVPALRRTFLYRHLELDASSLYPRETPDTALAMDDYDDFDDALLVDPEDTLTTYRKRPGPKRKTKSRNPELQILKHEDEEIVLTPVVSRIAQQLRHLKLPHIEEVEAAQASTSSSRRRKLATVHKVNPEKIVWGRRCHYDGETNTAFYDSVKIDGVQYRPGDLVMVEPGDDVKQARVKASEIVHTTNPLAQRNWFARIEYLHDGDGVKSFHARWFSHSSKTMLQEFSNPAELFWIKECDNCALSSILQKCALEVLPAIGAVNEESAVESLPNDHFFHRNLFFDEDCVAWTNLEPEVIEKALAMCQPHKQCVACGLSELDDLHESFHLLDDNMGFMTGGIAYHRHECMYLYNSADDNKAYDLAQLLDWEGPSDALRLFVRYFHRHDDLTRQERGAGTAGDDWRMDERHIFLTGREEIIKADRLAGKFFLRRHEPEDKNWLLNNPDIFYCTHHTDVAQHKVQSARQLQINKSATVKRCKACFDEMIGRDLRLRSVERLRGLEIFAGAGGLSEGLKSIVETKWHIEFSSSCGLTLQANHPNAVVYVQDCNKVLKRDLDLSEGNDPAPLLSLLDKTELPPLPGPGEVDIIFGGPPCQSFSKANHHKKEDDPRSMLALVLLSYAERLKPDYIIIENVVGFAEHKAMLQDGRQVNNAMLKIVPRVALALGYQVHGRILQAAQLGVAQGRRRFIYILARRGIPLPQHPLPTHVYDSPHKINLPTGQALRGLSRATHGFLTESSRSGYYKMAPSAAPHPIVTIEQAIGDLPKFHWRRPGMELKVTKAQRQDEAERDARGEPVFDAVGTGRAAKYVGFTSPQLYAEVSRSTYQDVMRLESGDKVSLQYTKSFTTKVIERVTAVPMKDNANWRDLPVELSTRIRDTNSNTVPGKTMLLRLPADAVFGTSTTDAYPLSKTGAPLHYSQRRTTTLRESARAQGFPDHYRLCSVNKTPIAIMADQQRQIGNAVPVPLARALAEQSLRPAVLAWHEQQTQGDETE